MMFIPIRNTVSGYMLTRHFGIPLARFERGSEIVSYAYGITTYHALNRLNRKINS